MLTPTHDLQNGLFVADVAKPTTATEILSLTLSAIFHAKVNSHTYYEFLIKSATARPSTANRRQSYAAIGRRRIGRGGL